MDLYQPLYDFIAEAQNYSGFLAFYSGPLKRIDYLKQICLAHPLSFECFYCSYRNSFLYFYLLSLQLALCRVAALKSGPVHLLIFIFLFVNGNIKLVNDDFTKPVNSDFI